MARRPYACYVVGGGYEYIKMMHEFGFTGAKGPENADLILFTGGEDVDPAFYNENKLKQTTSNPDRDRREALIYNEALNNGIPCVGICRGGQFLNVMNNGKMWQHVNGHTGNHQMLVIPKTKGEEKRVIEVTSTHHQMMRPGEGAVLLAVGVDDEGKPLCDTRLAFGAEVNGKHPKNHPDIEVVYYPKTRSLCFQPHPEFTKVPAECRLYFEELLDDYILPYCE